VLFETLYKLSVVNGWKGLLMSLPVRATVTARVEAVTPKGDEWAHGLRGAPIPPNEAVKTRDKRGNPETKKYTQLITAIHN
jgi:hypothetical protein